MSASAAAWAAHASKPQTRASYENWRPPILWAAVLVRVEPDHLVLNDTSGRGDFVLPGAPITGRQVPVEAARRALFGSVAPVFVPVAIDHVQMRRRQVTVHLLASLPIPRIEAAELAPGDRRATPRILPVKDALALLPSRARTRATAGLATLHAGRTVPF